MLIAERSSTETFIYHYTSGGSIIGMSYRNASYAEGVFDTYVFEKNILGDIVAVYDINGVKHVSYRYDAWGNFTTTYHNGTTSSSIAARNPFRYRGYYYDKDLGLYYLQTRYYDSNTGRFINADGYVSTGQGILGNNMFAYCNNNPVMFTDPTGEKWELLKKVGNFAWNIVDAYWGALEIDVGLGWGLNVDTDVAGIGAYRDFYIGIDDGKFVTGNIIDAGISAGMDISIVFDHRVEENGEFVCEDVDTKNDNMFSMLFYPETRITQEVGVPWLDVNSEGDIKMGTGMAFHAILGGHYNATFNFSDFFRRLFD